MAEAVSKAGMFSPFSAIKQHQIQHRHAPSSFNCKSPLFSSGMGFPSVRLTPTALATSSNTNFLGRRFLIRRHPITPRRANSQFFTISQMSIGIGKAQKWWEKGLQPNMKEVKGAQDLVESLLNAGDKLVVVDFFSPGCGGCKALHPKICQLAEMNPDVQFLQVNYEEHKSMCYTLHVHVLPFFRFYRGADGRLCSFSCTNATIKKFKGALAKHSPQRCSLGPPKGLEEKELLALSANKDLSFNYAPKPEQPVPTPAQEKILAEEVSAAASPSELDHRLPLPRPVQSSGSLKAAQDYEEKSLVSSSR